MLEDLADPSKIGDVDDPRNLARWAKSMGSALGDEGGEDFGAMMDEMLETEREGGGGEAAGADVATDGL